MSYQSRLRNRFLLSFFGVFLLFFLLYFSLFLCCGGGGGMVGGGVQRSLCWCMAWNWNRDKWLLFFLLSFSTRGCVWGGGGSKLVSKRARALTTTIGGCFLLQIVSNSINGRAPFSLFFLFFFLLLKGGAFYFPFPFRVFFHCVAVFGHIDRVLASSTVGSVIPRCVILIPVT